MPDKFYLVEGIPQKFHFENLVLTEYLQEYAFRPRNSIKPKHIKRARYIEFFPEKGDAGEYDLTIAIFNWRNEHIKDVTIPIVVSPATCGAGQDLTALAIGHSMSNYWPGYFVSKVNVRGDMKMQMVGSREFLPKLPGIPAESYANSRHENSSGYNFTNLLNRTTNPSNFDGMSPSKRLFLFEDDAFNSALKKYMADGLTEIGMHCFGGITDEQRKQ